MFTHLGNSADYDQSNNGIKMIPQNSGLTSVQMDPNPAVTAQQCPGLPINVALVLGRDGAVADGVGVPSAGLGLRSINIH